MKLMAKLKLEAISNSFFPPLFCWIWDLGWRRKNPDPDVKKNTANKDGT
jgi:hypothetical protein